MPFPRTWSEELVAEWLQLEGYFVDVDIPIRSGEKGGRKDADVIGVKMDNGRLKIYHIEVGELGKNPRENAKIVKERFSDDRKNAIIEYCERKLKPFSSKRPEYICLYIAVWRSDKTEAYLKQQGLPISSLWDFIKKEIRPTIMRWKDKPSHRPQTSGTTTIPDNMWLLYMLDYLQRTAAW